MSISTGHMASFAPAGRAAAAAIDAPQVEQTPAWLEAARKQVEAKSASVFASLPLDRALRRRAAADFGARLGRVLAHRANYQPADGLNRTWMDLHTASVLSQLARTITCSLRLDDPARELVATVVRQAGGPNGERGAAEQVAALSSGLRHVIAVLER